MIDLKSKIEVKYYDAGEKAVTVNFPADDLWCKRNAKMRVEESADHTGATTRKRIGEDAANMALLKSDGVIVGGSEPEDPSSATAVVERLESCSTSHERVGERILVTLAFWGRETRHLMNGPTRKQLKTWANGRITGKRLDSKTVAYKHRLEASGEFYDAIVESVEGYAPGCSVPIIHKDAVAVEVDAAIDEILRPKVEEADPEAQSPEPVETSGLLSI